MYYTIQTWLYIQCFLIADHIWQVEIKPKGLGVSKHLCGGYRFCLQDTVCFVRNNSDKVDFEIQVMCSLFKVRLKNVQSLLINIIYIFASL